MTEKQLQNNILQLASLSGWLAYHTFNSRRSEPGFPDLVLARRDRLLFAELKSAKGRLTSEQKAWAAALKETSAEIYLWRPKDWIDGTVQSILQ